jgi:hypothetical protein
MKLNKTVLSGLGFSCISPVWKKIFTSNISANVCMDPDMNLCLSLKPVAGFYFNLACSIKPVILFGLREYIEFRF